MRTLAELVLSMSPISEKERRWVGVHMYVQKQNHVPADTGYLTLGARRTGAGGRARLTGIAAA